MNKTIKVKAQKLYDFREEVEFCSAADLSEFFQRQTGDPSPDGAAEISLSAANEFIVSSLESMTWNSPSLAGHCQAAREAWYELTDANVPHWLGVLSAAWYERRKKGFAADAADAFVAENKEQAKWIRRHVQCPPRKGEMK